MAEVIGVVASGISIGTLAAQIAASLTKLKFYWDQIQEAPDDIASLVEEVENLHLLLSDIEDDQRRNPISSLLLDDTSASRCLNHCKRGADRLSELTEELALDIQHSSRGKRKWAAAKVVLKKDKLEKYRSNLERTIRLLSLSHQCYTRALLQLQPDIIVSKLREVSTCTLNSHSIQDGPQMATGVGISSSTKNLTWKNHSHRSHANKQAFNFWTPFGSIQYEKSVASQTALQKLNDNFQERQDTRYTLRGKLRGSVSILNKIWEVEGFNARSRWTFTIQTYNVISDESPVVNSLLPIDYHIYFGLPENLSKPTRIVDTFRLLFENGSSPPQELSDYQEHVEGFRLLTQHANTTYSQWSIDERVSMAISLIRAAPYNKLDIVRAALYQESLDYTIASSTNNGGKTLLHALAESIGHLTGLRFDYRRYNHVLDNGLLEEYDADLQDWRKLLKDVISQGVQLSPVSHSEVTPFVCLFTGLFDQNWRYGHKIQPSLFKMWLEDLRAAGVDLKTYGAVENRLLKQNLDRNLKVYYWDGWPPYDDLSWWLIDFKYGDSPEDWYIWVSDIGDEGLGDFWRMIERSREQKMPGAWIEDEN